MLHQIRDYLQQRGQASLQDIALHLDADPQAVSGMLAFWQRKGLVSQAPKLSCGDSCGQCSPESQEIWIWCERRIPLSAIKRLR